MNNEKCSRCGSVFHTLLECGVPLKRGQPPKDGVAASGHIQLRVTLARKSAYVRAAKPGKLSAWIFRHLDAHAQYEPSDIERIP